MPGLLGIECGATHTVTLHESGGKIARAEFGPANLRLLDDAQLEGIWGLHRATAR